MRQVVMTGAVALAGCLGGHEPVEARLSEPVLTEPDSWEPEQGTHILGSAPDQLIVRGGHIRAWTGLVVAGLRYRLSVTAEADGANLVADLGAEHHEKADPWFKDKILETSDGGQLWIKEVKEVAPDEIDGHIFTSGPSTLYTLDYRRTPNGNWESYCGGQGGAIALRGAYDASRVHHDVEAITFACPDGIVYKCNFWGYVAGNGGPGTGGGWDHHRACTRLGNASYCGNELSFTREKTPILIRDNVSSYGNDLPNDFGHPAKMPGEPDTFYIEAGWSVKGPICLSRLRWAGLPPNPCPDVLPDPRFVRAGEEHCDDCPPAEFCDKWTIDQLFNRGAILVNGSRMMDAPLHRWRNPTTHDEVSTIRGYFLDRNHDNDADPESTPPFSGYTEHRGTEGMLLRNLPGTLSVTQMKAIYMQSPASGDRFLFDAGGGRLDPSFEGYSFLQQTTMTNQGRPVRNLQPFSRCTGPDGMDTRLVAPNQCNAGTSLSFALPSP